MLFSRVKAQHCVPLTQLALAAERAENLAGIKVLVVFGNDQAARFEQPRTREKAQHLLVIVLLSVRRIEETKVARLGPLIELAKSSRNIAFGNRKALADAERLKVAPYDPDGPA